MKISNLYALADAALNDRLGQVAASVLASPATYGLTVPIANAMTSAAANFESSLADWDNARIAAESANFIKTTDRETALNTFGQYLNLMYATPTVTEAAITNLGFDPRSTVRNEIVPSTPLDLIATPNADGTAKVKWNKGANKYGVVYQLEVAEADANEWTLIDSTTKTSLTVNGMNPGTPRWFRVKATKNGIHSGYSFVAGIYIPMPGSEIIEIAA